MTESDVRNYVKTQLGISWVDVEAETKDINVMIKIQSSTRILSIATELAVWMISTPKIVFIISLGLSINKSQILILP